MKKLADVYQPGMSARGVAQEVLVASKNPAGVQASGAEIRDLEGSRTMSERSTAEQWTGEVDVACDRPGCLAYGTGTHKQSNLFDALHTALDLSDTYWSATVDWDGETKEWILCSTFTMQQVVETVDEVLATTRAFESALVRARGRLQALNSGGVAGE